MQTPNHDLPKLTKNEQSVLRKIISVSKIPDTKIATEMGLSQQAIFKIRHKLEKAGIIKGYMPIIDFKKIGVGTLAVLGLQFTDGAWKKYSEEELYEKIRKLPQVITAYRIPESKISHLLVMGFENIDHKDKFLMKLQSKYSHEIKVVQVYPFSVDRIIKDSPIGLLNSILNKKEFFSVNFFLDK